MPTTKTTAPQATVQAAPAPATATTQRVKKERITLEFSDIHQAFEVLSVLCLNVEGLHDDLGHHGWQSARTANKIAIAPGALSYHADALTDAMIDRRNARGGDEGDAHERWEESPPAAAPPARKAGFVKPSSVARLEALRGEFSDDPGQSHLNWPEHGEEVGEVPARLEPLGFGAHLGRALLREQIERHVAQDGHVGRPVVGAHAALVRSGRPHQGSNGRGSRCPSGCAQREQKPGLLGAGSG